MYPVKWRSWRSHASALGIILLVAADLRLLWVLGVPTDPRDGRFDDTVWYREAAHFISIGEGYLNPFTGTPTAGWPPGYPYFLGGIFALFGEGTRQTYFANVALALVAVAGVYALAHLLFGRRTAVIAAALVALWPGQVFFMTLTLSEPLFTALFVLATLAMVLVAQTSRYRFAVAVTFGVLTALAALTRGQGMILLPLALVTWGASGVRWRSVAVSGALSALAIAAVFTPWVIRNERLLGSPVLVATNMGPNMYIGNHEGAGGRMWVDDPRLPQPENSHELTQPEIEVAADRIARDRALDYIRSHPEDQPRLAWNKVRALYESDTTGLDWNSRWDEGRYEWQRAEPMLRDLANGFWFTVLALAGAGLLTLRRRALRSPAIALPLILLGWTATHLLFFGDPRFHYPLAFVLAILAARSLALAAEWAAARRSTRTPVEGYAPA